MSLLMAECCTSTERRTVIGKGWLLIKICATAAILSPIIRFVTHTVPPKPLIFEINKNLKKGGFILESEFIIFDHESGPVAVSRTCTHLGCRLNFHELENKLICPCHQSSFDKSGKRLAGPAERNLPVYDVERIQNDKGFSYLVTVG